MSCLDCSSSFGRTGRSSVTFSRQKAHSTIDPFPELQTRPMDSSMLFANNNPNGSRVVSAYHTVRHHSTGPCTDNWFRNGERGNREYQSNAPGAGETLQWQCGPVFFFSAGPKRMARECGELAGSKIPIVPCASGAEDRLDGQRGLACPGT